MSTHRTPRDHAANYLVRAAVTAPSLHNSQPWLFTCRGGDILLYADVTRRLLTTDPSGREMALSCGAALFNLRIAMRHLGFLPVVRPHPDPRLPTLLARVSWGAYARTTPEEELMHQALRRRHTHRGPFQPTPLPAPLVNALRRQALAEGAEFSTLAGPAEQRRLAAIVREAEAFQRSSPGHAAELARWTQPQRGRRLDGVPAEASPFPPDSTLLAARDFTGHAHNRTTGGSGDSPWTSTSGTGLVVLLNTPHDTPQDWLRAGQALQRILLYAAGHRVRAGFHTQPLEIPGLRAEVRTMIASRQCPQMIMRLGHSNRPLRTPRRPVQDVLSIEEPAAA
ncbi:hypothetical protein U9R90_07835 [Streptomyces sp. E11-3]|uniref:Acg family FMN-binding oxidoreductase n=1 Tax=Streptomyces sp. E11-3 TaxID=3110112 RepID=UPI003981646D